MRKLVALPTIALMAMPAFAEAVKVDAGVAAYQKTDSVSGKLSSVGSDTMNNLMTLWIEGFSKVHSGVQGQVEGKGSSTAPPALIEGLAQLGPMSRDMKSEEKDKFEERFGYPPTTIRTAVDALAVYVNKDNPIKGLSLAQVDGIFSKTFKRASKESASWGGNADIVTWEQLDVTGALAGKPISLYGRNSASGTYGFFKEHVLSKGDYRDTVKEQPGSAAVVQGVENDKFGIGYSGIGYKTSGVIAVPLASEGTDYKEANFANCLDGSYPLSRYLYININKDPRKPLDPLLREFLRYVLSKDGQEVVIKDGYLPLPAKVVAEELAKLD